MTISFSENHVDSNIGLLTTNTEHEKQCHLDPFGFVLLYDCLLIYNVKTTQRSYYNENDICMHVCYLSPSR